MTKRLTKAEEEIMHLFWSHGPSTVSALIEHIPDPKPATTTISSFVRILEKKGFIDHKAYGRTYEYFPIITKEEYSSSTLKTFISNYFEGSVEDLVSFIIKDRDLSIKDVSKLLDELEKADKS